MTSFLIKLASLSNALMLVTFDVMIYSQFLYTSCLLIFLYDSYKSLIIILLLYIIYTLVFHHHHHFLHNIFSMIFIDDDVAPLLILKSILVNLIMWIYTLKSISIDSHQKIIDPKVQKLKKVSHVMNINSLITLWQH